MESSPQLRAPGSERSLLLSPAARDESAVSTSSKAHPKLKRWWRGAKNVARHEAPSHAPRYGALDVSSRARDDDVLPSQRQVGGARERRQADAHRPSDPASPSASHPDPNAKPLPSIWQRMRACFQRARRNAFPRTVLFARPPRDILVRLSSDVRDDLGHRKWIGDTCVANGKQAWKSLRQDRAKKLALDIRSQCAKSGMDIAEDFDLREGSVSEQLYHLIERINDLYSPASYAMLVRGFYASEDPRVYTAARVTTVHLLQLEKDLIKLRESIVPVASNDIAPPMWGHFGALPNDGRRRSKGMPTDPGAERLILSVHVRHALRHFDDNVAMSQPLTEQAARA